MVCCIHPVLAELLADDPGAAPVITCSEPITVSVSDDAVAITATATDAEDDANGVALAASCQPDSTAGLALGSSETTCSVTDSDGNTETCTAAVTVTGALRVIASRSAVASAV